MYNTPLILQQRAGAAGNESAGRYRSAHAHLPSDVNAGTTQAHAVVQLAIAQNNFEAGDSE